jgi:periplasmic divalent cation tolerance protein
MPPFWEGAPLEDRQHRDILAITTTVGSRADAESLAREIIERRLAACVQVEEGLTSFYRWQGKACEDAEVRLTIKTLPACEAELRELFLDKHPYEVPQFLSTTMRASAEYLAWVQAEVRVPAAGGEPDPV